MRISDWSSDVCSSDLIFRAALVVLVEHDQLGEVDHVDLLELAGGAVVAGHHVHREVDQVDDLRVGLADAGGLDDDEVIAQRLEEGDAVLEHDVGGGRSEEHTSELQSLMRISYAVFCLKKK